MYFRYVLSKGKHCDAKNKDCIYTVASLHHVSCAPFCESGLILVIGMFFVNFVDVKAVKWMAGCWP